MKRIAVTLSILLLLVVIPFSVSLFQQRVGYRGRAAGDSALLINQAHSLRFFGHGFGNIDRVEIRIDDPTNNNPGPPADIGATDFTIEFWMKAKASENASDRVGCGQNINWIHGNIVIDRDRFNQDRKFGLSIAGGSIVFGIIDKKCG